jgi:hypothetical protein
VINEETLVDDFFKPGGAKKIVDSLVQQGVSAQTSQIIMTAQQQDRRVLKVDPETKDIFNRYEREIQAEIDTLPPDHPARMRADLYTLAYQTVFNKHQNEIIAERAKPSEDQIEEAVQARLKEMGVAVPVRKGPAVRSEASVGARPSTPSKKLYITSEDIRVIKERCLDPKDPDVVKDYLAEKAAKGGRK